MPRRARWAVLAVLVAALGVAVVVAGRPGELLPVTGVQRLGPEAGEPVADYLRRASASLPATESGSVWALVQLDSYLTPGRAAELAQGVRLSRVVLRVPLPRVQTALITRDLPGQRPVAELTDALRSAAQDRAAVAARNVPGGRPATVAAAEAAQLRDGCACVLAFLVFGDGDALQAVAGRPGVGAVHAALPDTPIQDVAISPLLPEQVDTAGPVPDDGPVPP
ncbi:MAG TPA: hypothetical protein VHH52_04735 [Pseudonocardiaceae bacterium]|jgi:hypothetical protein|nr:hypothetical protein [Pseudonocardiaceae bacterium]